MSVRFWMILVVLLTIGCDVGESTDGGTQQGNTDIGVSDAAGETADAATEADLAVGGPDGGGQPDGGQLDGGQQPDAAQPDAAASAVCPPEGPYGSSVGDRVDDVQVPSCNGASFGLHAACGVPTWAFVFAGWCPPCRRFAGQMGPLIERARALGYQPLFVISESPDFRSADEAYCGTVAETYGHDVPFLYDAQGAFQARFGVASNSVNVVIGADGTLLHKQQWNDVDDMEAILERLAED